MNDLSREMSCNRCRTLPCRFNGCSACTAASAVVTVGPPSTSTLLCTSGCRTHRCWRPSNPTALSTQRPLIRVVGNTVNTPGDRWHDCCADDRLVYSSYNGDIYSPGEHFLCRQQRLLYSLRVARLVPWCGVCGLGKYYIDQKPKLS